MSAITYFQSFVIQSPFRQHPMHSPQFSQNAMIYSTLPDYANSPTDPIPSFGIHATPPFQPSQYAIAGQHGLHYTPQGFERQRLLLPAQDHHNNLHRRDRKAEGQIARSTLLEDFRSNVVPKKWVLQVSA